MNRQLLLCVLLIFSIVFFLKVGQKYKTSRKYSVDGLFFNAYGVFVFLFNRNKYIIP